MSATAKACLWAIALAPLAVFALHYARLAQDVVMQWTMTGTPGWRAPKWVFGICLLIEPVIAFVLLGVHRALPPAKLQRLGGLYPAILIVTFAIGSTAEVLAILANRVR